MLAVLSIFLLGIVLCLLAGAAIGGLTDPGERLLGARTLPLGLCTLIAMLYYLGAFMPGYRSAPTAVALVFVGLAGAICRLRRQSPGDSLPAVLRRAAGTTRAGAIALAGAVIAGLLALLPVMKLGFPTTIGVSNNDGWGYASLVEWLKDHPGPRNVQPELLHPLTQVPWSTFSNHFGFGFEHFAAALASLLHRDGFEVVNAAAAVALAAGLGGWVMLGEDIRPDLRGWETCLIMLAVATPVLALPFAENYTTQFVSLCLWPVALSSFVRFSRRPGIGRLILAGLGVGAVVGVYPAVVPWLVLPLVGAAVLAPSPREWEATPLRGLTGETRKRRIARAGALLGALVVALMVLVPIPMVRGTQNLLFLDSVVAGLSTFFSGPAYAAYALGAASSFSLFSLAPLTWATIVSLLVMIVVYVVGLTPLRRPRGSQLLLLVVAAGVLLTTAVVYVRFRYSSPLPYQTYKGLTSGGAILAGIVVLALVTSTSSRGRTIRRVAIGAVIAVWVPVTASILQATVLGGTGFRAADVQMGRTLRALPQGSVVLVEGPANDERSFQLRMMAAYFGTSTPGLTTIGLGSTVSYLTPGGLDEWRPAQPWTEVLGTRPQPVVTPRRPEWGNAVYSLASAPELDLTTYGSNWYPTENEGATVFAWTAGPSQLVLSNRFDTPRAVRLQFSALSYARPRTLTVTTPRGIARQRLAGDVMMPVGIDMILPARSATPVALSADPGATKAPPGDGRMLMVRFQRLRLTER
jgi:hypothetical protein